MLKQLTVSNFALIENAKLNINKGFTVITGETGSGKSILLGSLKLILGERADYSVIRDQDKKTVVEALFGLNDKRFAQFFKENDLDFDPETIIRREISPSGKSRAFINDTPVQLTLLKELTERLVHIHSQHHTLELRNKDFQRAIVDTVADNQVLLANYQEEFRKTRRLQREIKELEENRSQLMLEYEFNSFQLEELEKLDLRTQDYAHIESEVQRSDQYEELKEAFQLIAHSINGEESVLDILRRVQSHIKVDDKSINELMERIRSVMIELEDIASEAENNGEESELDPEEISRYLVLLDAYNTALRKHNLQTQEELMQLSEELSVSVQDSGNIEELIQEKQAELAETLAKATELAEKLREKRQMVAKTIEKTTKELLNQLKLEGATIEFKFQPTELNEFGHDEIQLYFAPNKGLQPQLIEKSASGGELSRLMLALQFQLSKKQELPTVIFDEIDTGVSGEVAQKIGIHLKEMGEHMQLIAITHLPQVASKGKHHILVRKSDKEGITTTSFKELEENERIEEIAKLMSGSTINEAALLNAKSLMNE